MPQGKEYDMAAFFTECDRLARELDRRALDWNIPAKVPNTRRAAAVAVACATALVLAVTLQ